jgi:hypothetical protein
MNLIDGGKNQIYEDGDKIYIKLTNIVPEVFISASCEDLDLISEHRWRLISTQVITTIPSGTIEITQTLDSILTGISRKKTVRKINGNLLDYTRRNISLTQRSSNQIIDNDKDTSYLIVKGVPPIIIDKEDVIQIEKFYWTNIKIKGEDTLLTVYREDDKSRRRQLARYILGLSITDSRVIWYANGDRFDCRKQNLMLKPRNQK